MKGSLCDLTAPCGTCQRLCEGTVAHGEALTGSMLAYISCYLEMVPHPLELDVLAQNFALANIYRDFMMPKNHASRSDRSWLHLYTMEYCIFHKGTIR